MKEKSQENQRRWFSEYLNNRGSSKKTESKWGEVISKIFQGNLWTLNDSNLGFQRVHWAFGRGVKRDPHKEHGHEISAHWDTGKFCKCLERKNRSCAQVRNQPVLGFSWASPAVREENDFQPRDCARQVWRKNKHVIGLERTQRICLLHIHSFSGSCWRMSSAKMRE